MMPASASGLSLVALRITDEAAFVERVREALERASSAKGDRLTFAALALGVGRRTLFRWLKKYPQILEKGR